MKASPTVGNSTTSKPPLKAVLCEFLSQSHATPGRLQEVQASFFQLKPAPTKTPCIPPPYLNHLLRHAGLEISAGHLSRKAETEQNQTPCESNPQGKLDSTTENCKMTQWWRPRTRRVAAVRKDKLCTIMATYSQITPGNLTHVLFGAAQFLYDAGSFSSYASKESHKIFDIQGVHRDFVGIWGQIMENHTGNKVETAVSFRVGTSQPHDQRRLGS